MIKAQQMAQNVKPRSGEYEVQIIEAAEGRSKLGAEMVTVCFETTDPSKERIWDHFVIGQRVSERRLVSLLSAIGLQDVEALEAKELVGKTLKVHAEIETYNREQRLKAKKYLPLNA